MKEMPLTVRRSAELIGLFFLGWILVVGKQVITPILMAFFVSIVLLPLYRFLRKNRIPEILSIAISILIMLIIFGLLIWFFSSQMRQLLADLPTIRNNVTLHLNSLSAWINAKVHFSSDEQIGLIQEQSNKILSYGVNFLGGAAGSVTSLLVFLGLLPIYTFLILFYKNLLLRFIFMWFPTRTDQRVKAALSETEIIIKSYLIGLLIQVTYMTIIVGGTLLMIGIKHALLIGIIFALLNLIPYVGALIGNIIGVLLTLASSPNLGPIITVLATIAAAQFLDNNILMPRIVGSKVKINALATIVGVLIGGELAGIAGMFLSLPLIAVMKVVFDRTDNLKQWGELFGDERPTSSPMQNPALREKNEAVQEKLERKNNIEPLPS